MTDTVAFSDNFAVTTKKGVLGAANTQTVELKERLPGNERLFSRVYVDRFGMITGGVFAEDAGLPDDPQFGGQMGMRVPSGTSDQRPTNGVAIIRYNTELKAFEVNEDGSWVRPFQASNLRAVESDILPNVQSSQVYQVNIGSQAAPFVSGTFGRIVLVSKQVLSDADLAADVLVNKNGTLYFGGVAIGGLQPYDLAPATDTQLGGVKIGNGITVGTDGTIAISFYVKGSDTDSKPGTLEDKLSGAGGITVTVDTDPVTGDRIVIDGSKIKTYGAAGGDLVGAFPNPVVRQITGVPATLAGSQAKFDWKPAGSWAAGAGISYGFGYVGGVRKRCWMANSQLGELHATYDDWLSVVHVPSGNPYYGTYTNMEGQVFTYSDLVLALGTSPRFASVTYIQLPGSASMYWVFTAQNKIYAIEDLITNYHDNGALKLEAIFEITLAGDMGDPNSLAYGNNTLVFVGNNASMYYAEDADMNWTTKTLTTHGLSSTVVDTVPDPDTTVTCGVMGGITFDGTRFLTVGRDTGVLLQSTTGKSWSILRVNSVKFQDDSDMLHRSSHEYSFALPMNTREDAYPSWSNNDNVCWGGMTYAFDRYIVVNGKTAPSSVSSYWSPFLFSYDGVNWFAYKPTQVEMESNYTYSCYKLAAGNHRVYATNSYPMQYASSEPSIYRLLVDEVPFHANLLAEKDLIVLGEATLSGNKEADYLSTDADGAVVSHTLPANASVLGTDANKAIVAKTLPLASASVAGTVKVGAGLSIDGTGTLSSDAAAPDFIAFDTTPETTSSAIGTLSWNDTDDTLNLIQPNGTTLQIGQEAQIKIVNKTGGTIGNGQVVYITGAQGNRITVGLAQANSITTSQAIAVATNSIANNAEGFVTQLGLVRDLDTLAYAEGSVVYLSETTAGGWRSSAPTPQSRTVRIGYVVRSHATEGSIFVAIQHVENLGDLGNVSATTPADGQVLTFETATGKWKPSTPTGGSGTGEITVVSLSGSANTLEAGHLSALVRITHTGPTTYTIPVGIAAGKVVHVRQAGVGQVVITPAVGVTITTPETLITRTQGSTVSLISIGSDVWDLVGDVEVA